MKRRCQLVNGKIETYCEVPVHYFKMGDTDDISVYAAEPISKWTDTDAGKFVMEHCIGELKFLHTLDAYSYLVNCALVAELEEKKLSEFYLKWGKPNDKSV